MIKSLSVITFVFLPWALAAPHLVSHPESIHVPLLRRGNISERVASLPKVMDAIKRKYKVATTNKKRSGGTGSSYIPVTDEVCHFRFPAPRMVSILQLTAKGRHLFRCCKNRNAVRIQLESILPLLTNVFARAQDFNVVLDTGERTVCLCLECPLTRI